MRLSLAEWEACDPEWFRLAMEGIARRERERYKDDWNRARWMTAYLLSVHSRSPVKPTDLLEWPEERAARIRELKELSDRMNEDKRFAKTITIKQPTDEQSN